MSTHENVALEHAYAEVNGVRLHYVKAGAGPLMLFLHGFPQCWYTFRHQLAEFARDHTVVAPDLRGYNLSAKPTNLRDYGTWQSVDDCRALVRHLGFETYSHVGLDWGGAVGYSVALHYPEMLERLVILSVAHPGAFDRELHDNPAQIHASQYLLFLRQSDSAEPLVENDMARLKAVLAADFFSDEDRRVYQDVWRQPGAVQGMVALYQREGLGPREGTTPARGNTVPEVAPLTIHTPSLVVYGSADPYVLPGCFEGLDNYMTDVILHRIEGGSHWLLDEHPQLVNRLIREFIDGATVGSSRSSPGSRAGA
jgi:epoxide hydrolase 4